MRGGGPGTMGGGAGFGPGGGRGPGLAGLRTEVQLRDGSWARFDTELPEAPQTLPWRLVLTLAVLLASVLALSFVAVRWVVRPLQQLTEAAQALGEDLNRPPLPEDGPREVRQAAQAFNTMQQRLAAFIDERTRLLTALSHDLKTPLTRMRLRADLLDFTAAGRVESVRQLLPRLEQAGIRKLLVDTCFLDLATYGQACQALWEIKDEFGLPAGGGVHNAVATWKGLKKKLGGEAKDACVAAACASAVAIGGDFLLYGPVEDAKYIFPAVAMIDTGHSQVAIERGLKPDPNHPRYRVG